MSDYAEFMAGTNPTNAASKLVFLATTLTTNNLVQFEWAAVPGRLYQVQASILNPTNLQTWTPVSDWRQASGSPMYFTATNADQGSHAFRVQVRP